MSLDFFEDIEGLFIIFISSNLQLLYLRLFIDTVTLRIRSM